TRCHQRHLLFLQTSARLPTSHLLPYTTPFRSHRGTAAAQARSRATAARSSAARSRAPRPAAASRRSPAPWRRASVAAAGRGARRSEEHTSELQSLTNLVCRLLLDKKKPSTSEL